MNLFYAKKDRLVWDADLDLHTFMTSYRPYSAKFPKECGLLFNQVV